MVVERVRWVTVLTLMRIDGRVGRRREGRRKGGHRRGGMFGGGRTELVADRGDFEVGSVSAI